ncbi:hypothetical protein Cpir12675_006767 [Ceratocystis pirilliformis]|uniref:Methyltransferase type 11 domain-containing protein n=1 Tax=Ceratocystis pirilliformis TaxID=259994 RepID=A0ABR3YFE3_9PEZI
MSPPTPPPAGPTTRYHHMPRIYSTSNAFSDDRLGFAAPTPASTTATVAPMPRLRPHRDTSEPPRLTPSAATASTRLPQSTRRVSFNLSETPRSIAALAPSLQHQQQGQAVQKLLLPQQPPQKRTLTKRRSAVIQDIPQIDTRVPPTYISRIRGPSPVNPPAAKSASRHPSSPSTATSGTSIRIYPELDRWPRHVRQPSATSSTDSQVNLLPLRLATDLAPATTPSIMSGASSQLSASPSTRFSESPGPWPWSGAASASASAASIPMFAGGQNSRDTTPISALSPSPASGLGFAARGAVVPRATGSPVGVASPMGNAPTGSSVRGPPLSPPLRKSSWTSSPRQRTAGASPILPTASSTPRARRLSNTTQPQRFVPPTARPVAAAASPRVEPPHRPSRDGIPNILGLHQEFQPIIQSNLNSIHIPKANVGKHTDAISSSPDHTRRTATTPTAHPGQPQSRGQPQRGYISSHEATSVLEPVTRQLRTPSPITSASSRFAFFGKKKLALADSVGSSQASRDKLPRKGPAAGTGHEGYGRFGTARKRSGSFTGAFRGLPSSQESLPMDSFFLDRMSPVIISGGEVVKNHNDSGLSRTSSNNSLIAEPGGFASPASSPRPSMSRYRIRRPSDSSDSEAVAGYSVLQVRKLRDYKKKPSADTPSTPTLTLDTGVATSAGESLVAALHASSPVLSPGPKKLLKRARSPRRWNLFSSKAHHNAEKDKEKTTPDVSAESGVISPPLPAAVEPVPSRRVAYYMIDAAEQEYASPSKADIGDVRNALRGADVRLPDSASPIRVDTTQKLDVERPGPPSLVSPVSFSRPFNRTSFHAAMLASRNHTETTTPATTPTTTEPAGSAPVTLAIGSSSALVSTPDLANDSTASATTTTESPCSSIPLRKGRTGMIIETSSDFIRFSARKSSTASTATTFSTSSTSSGPFLPIYVNTDVEPPIEAPLIDDEVWDEYNDLLGLASPTVVRPISLAIPSSIPVYSEFYDDDQGCIPQSSTSSRGSPFHLETYNLSLAPPTAPADGTRLTRTSSIGSVDMTERLREIFAPKPDLGSVPAPTPAPTRPIPALPSGANAAGPSTRARSSTTSSNQSRTSSASSISDSPLDQVNLRIGSMTVSKWLTFGHVMFSPVREQLIGATAPPLGSSVTSAKTSVLVLDGLGNDDWSFYAAETYPGAAFFNLSPRAPVPVDRRARTSFPLSPPNHHQIQYTSLDHKLPFGPETFAAVVLRFPAAGPEAHLRNVVSEARRVLIPGGYIELSILDMDLNNMGNRARRAVRRRKEMHRGTAPDTALGSTADTLLRLLGTRGFADVKSCHVGLPVVGPAAASDKLQGSKTKRDTRSLAEMMSDHSTTADESITRMVSKVGRWWYARCYEGLRTTGLQSGLDVSSGLGLGLGLGSGSSTSSSMWHDTALLAECADWGTSLKLMVCHARVPLGAINRVASI